MDYLKPFGVDLDLIQGVMKNPATHIVRQASSMRGHYADAAALERLIAAGDPVHYEVAEQPVPDAPGQMRFGISTTLPGTVGEECFMTKGHYHAVPDTAEVYVGLRGQGYMLMKTVEGECLWEEFRPGRVIYVPPSGPTARSTRGRSRWSPSTSTPGMPGTTTGTSRNRASRCAC